MLLYKTKFRRLLAFLWPVYFYINLKPEELKVYRILYIRVRSITIQNVRLLQLLKLV
jgi:hypothetical protein